MCKCAPHSSQITMPAPHHLVFLQAGCPSCCLTDSINALKVQRLQYHLVKNCKVLKQQQQTGVWYDLGRHEVVDCMKTSAGTATLYDPPTRLARFISVSHTATLAHSAVAVEAHDVATSRTRPVYVEQRRPATVAHFTNTLDRPLPRDVLCTQNHSLRTHFLVGDVA